MKKYSQILIVLSVVTIYYLMTLACAPSQKVVADTRYDAGFRVSAQKDEVVKNANKLQFLKTAVNPTIVLRVPNASREILEEDKNTKTPKNTDGTNNLNDINVYNVIEKELLKGGFTVRDRALFEKVLGDKSVSDYSKIKELTETDLIIELSSIQFVKYPVNTFTFSSQSRRRGTTENTFTCANYINLYGLKLEFRLIKVKENDFIGSFTYNYMPCDNMGCNYKVNVNAKNGCSVPYVQMGNVYLSDTKLISQQEIESFVKNSTQKLVSELFAVKN